MVCNTPPPMLSRVTSTHSGALRREQPEATSSGRGVGLASVGDRQTHHERCAGTQHGLDVHLTAVPLGDLLDDRQAQSHAGDHGGAGSPVERGKDVPQLFGRQTRAVVAHANLGGSAVVGDTHVHGGVDDDPHPAWGP